MEGAEGAWLRSVLPAEEEAGVVPGLSKVKKRDTEEGSNQGGNAEQAERFHVCLSLRRKADL